MTRQHEARFVQEAEADPVPDELALGVYNAAGEGIVHYREPASLARTHMITVPANLFHFLMSLS